MVSRTTSRQAISTHALREEGDVFLQSSCQAV